MNQKIYGVLKSKVLKDNGDYTSNRSKLTHYNLITKEGDSAYQVNIDIQSDPNTPNVRMLCIDNFQNDIIHKFDSISNGFTSLNPEKGGLALDYLRQNLFNQEDLFKSKPLTIDEITKILDKYLESHQNVIIFGTKYGDNSSNLENHYGTSRNLQNPNLPSQGVDDVHQNQGNVGFHAQSNGIYQDGAMFVKNMDNTYSAFFFSFTDQCSSTDEKGNCL